MPKKTNSTLQMESDELYQKAELCFQYGELVKAGSLLRTAINKNPHNSNAHRALGQVLQEKGKFTSSTAAYAASTMLNSTLDIGILELAESYERQKSFQQAEAFYKKILNGSTQIHRVLIGLARIEASKKNWLNALRRLKEAEIAVPNSASINYSMGLIYRQKGELLNAQKKLTKAHRLNNKSPGIMAQLALVQLKQGNVKAARTVASKCIKVSPNNESAKQILEKL
jgi:tetratricopeptide (TPR) repeat protein